MKNNHYHIILLQETFWINDDKKDIEKEWGGKVVLNHEAIHSKGTTILLNNSIIDESLNHVPKDVHLSDDGRIILLNLAIENKEFSLINIYAPNYPKDR